MSDMITIVWASSTPPVIRGYYFLNDWDHEITLGISIAFFRDLDSDCHQLSVRICPPS
jgi:hypothetical protein